MRTFIALLLPLLAIGPASADTIYSYMGPTFEVASGPYTTAMRLSGAFAVTGGPVTLPSSCIQIACNWTSVLDDVKGFTFSDGVQTLSSDNAVLDRLLVNPGGDSPHALNAWSLKILAPTGSITSFAYAADGWDQVSAAGGQANEPPNWMRGLGTWTVSHGSLAQAYRHQVPEPSTLALLLAAGGVGAVVRVISRSRRALSARPPHSA